MFLSTHLCTIFHDLWLMIENKYLLKKVSLFLQANVFLSILIAVGVETDSPEWGHQSGRKARAPLSPLSRVRWMLSGSKEQAAWKGIRFGSIKDGTKKVPDIWEGNLGFYPKLESQWCWCFSTGTKKLLSSLPNSCGTACPSEHILLLVMTVE